MHLEYMPNCMNVQLLKLKDNKEANTPERNVVLQKNVFKFSNACHINVKASHYCEVH